MDYGILKERTCFKLFERINTRFLCNQCHRERVKFSTMDKKKHNSHSNLLPGFSSENIKLPLDLLIVAEAHGGGREEDFRNQVDLKAEIVNLAEYYLIKPIKKYHQQEMRHLLNYLNNKRIKWVFTDLIKCFVWRGYENKNNLDGSENVRIAIRNCSTYLKEQIKTLRPKKVLALGKTVAIEYFKLPNKLEHGNTYAGLVGDQEFPIVYSIFPSQFTADLWVEHGGWKKVSNNINPAGQ